MDGKLTTDIATYLNVSSIATEQFLALATAYGMNFLAAVFTLALGIWLSRRASRLTGEWLSRLNRLDKTLVPIMAALVRLIGWR